MTHTLRVPRLVAAAAIAATIPLVAGCSSSPAPAGAGASAPAAPAASSAHSSASTTRPTTKAVAPADAAYCSALKSGRQELQSIPAKISDKAALEQGKAVLKKIQAAAPAEVKAAWGDFLAFVDAAASGDKKALATATPKMEPAGMKIQQNAMATCGFGLS